MSFLLDDASGSSSSESEEEIKEVRESEWQQEDPGIKDAECLLPAADSVLSSVTTSFLDPKKSVNPEAAVQFFDLQYNHKTQLQEQTKPETDKRPVERKRPLPPEIEHSSKREKKNAKERVKSQRLKGQSGIGSDFRSWKSETEMALRQQFD